MIVERLNCIPVGGRCVIDRLELHGAVRRRLIDMGFLPGTALQHAFSAPSGSPIAFWVRGSLIALREIDCEKIMVRLCA